MPSGAEKKTGSSKNKKSDEANVCLQLCTHANTIEQGLV